MDSPTRPDPRSPDRLQTLRDAGVSIWAQIDDPSDDVLRISAVTGVRLAPPWDFDRAASALRQTFCESRGEEGLVEVPAPLDADPEAVIDSVGELAAAGTRQVVVGLHAANAWASTVEELTFRGINTAIDGIVCAERYAAAAGAFMAGLERRARRRLPLHHIRTLVWVPLAGFDREADARLPPDSPLVGAVSIAAAQQVYLAATRHLAGPRWRQLADAGANRMRTGFRDFGNGRPSIRRLAFPGSILALSREDLEAARGDDRLVPAEPDETEVGWVLREAESSGASLGAIAEGIGRSLPRSDPPPVARCTPARYGGFR